MSLQSTTRFLTSASARRRRSFSSSPRAAWRPRSRATRARGPSLRSMPGWAQPRRRPGAAPTACRRTVPTVAPAGAALAAPPALVASLRRRSNRRRRASPSPRARRTGRTGRVERTNAAPTRPRSPLPRTRRTTRILRISARMEPTMRARRPASASRRANLTDRLRLTPRSEWTPSLMGGQPRRQPRSFQHRQRLLMSLRPHRQPPYRRRRPRLMTPPRLLSTHRRRQPLPMRLPLVWAEWRGSARPGHAVRLRNQRG